MKYSRNIDTLVTGPQLNSKVALIIGALVIIQLQTVPLTAQHISSSKSSATASAFAFLGTAGAITTAVIVDDVTVNMILIPGGLIFGPVLGYAYMDHPKIGMKYAFSRAIILGGTIGSIYLICSVGDCSIGLLGGDSGREFGFAMTIGLIGITATLIHNLVDIASVGRRVKSREKRFSVSPAYIYNTQTLGLRASWRF